MMPEMMDDFSIVDHRLDEALVELEQVNRLFGGHHATAAAIKRIIKITAPTALRFLDVGSGLGGHVAAVARMCRKHHVPISAVAVDANEATVDRARVYLREVVKVGEGNDVDVVVADARTLPFADGSFDVVHAALFLHHFDEEASVEVIKEMARVSSGFVIVNDLHRHLLPYAFLRLTGKLPFFGEMFTHDAPVSVLRAFRRAELHRIFVDAGLPNVSIRWHPGFRWIAVADVGGAAR